MNTVRDLLDDVAALDPQRLAVAVPGGEVTYVQLRELADEFERGLVAAGMKRGDRVAMLLHNSMDAIALVFACAGLGLTLVTINTRHRGPEIGHALRDSQARMVFTHASGSEVVDLRQRLAESGAAPGRGAQVGGESFPMLDAVVDLAEVSSAGMTSRAEFVKRGAGIVLRDAARGVAADPLVLLYTSGTTSLPKGCELSQEQFLLVAEALGDMWPMREGDVLWNPLPMFHVSGIMPMLATFIRHGTWLTMPRFDAALMIEMVKRHRPTLLWPAFPTIWQDVLTHPGFDLADFGSVRSVLCVAPFETLVGIESKLTSAPIVAAYGLTEAVGISFLPSSSDPPQLRLGRAGRPLPGLEVSIRDPETRTPLPRGQRGELWLRGRTVFRGYLHDAQKTREVFDADGWFCTGDLGRYGDDGFFTYEGRAKDMLKVGGENVAAAEVEALVSTCAGVKLTAVVGIPDARYGEVPVAFVEAMPGVVLDEDSVIRFCKERAAGYKVPRHVRFVTEWPMSTTKIRKDELRRRALDEIAARAA